MSIDNLATALLRAAHLGYVRQKTSHEPLQSWSAKLIASELRLSSADLSRRMLTALRAAFVAGWDLSSRSSS